MTSTDNRQCGFGQGIHSPAHPLVLYTNYFPGIGRTGRSGLSDAQPEIQGLVFWGNEELETFPIERIDDTLRLGQLSALGQLENDGEAIAKPGLGAPDSQHEIDFIE